MAIKYHSTTVCQMRCNFCKTVMVVLPVLNITVQWCRIRMWWIRSRRIRSIICKYHPSIIRILLQIIMSLTRLLCLIEGAVYRLDLVASNERLLTQTIYPPSTRSRWPSRWRWENCNFRSMSILRETLVAKLCTTIKRWRRECKMRCKL